MAIHLLITDPGTMDFGHDGLAARVEAQLGLPVAVFRPFTFVEHSGFTETVREEIHLVLSNHAPGEFPRRGLKDFVEAWGFGEYLDRRVLDLSGGWRKYLGLALFCNRPLAARLLFDTTSHLSDARLRTLLDQCADGSKTVFCEYDPELLRRLDPTLSTLVDDGARVLRPGDAR